MIGWIKRLIGQAEPAAPAPAAPAPAAAARGAGTAAAAACRVGGATALAGDAGVYGVQRPLVGRRGRIAGFECTLPPVTAERLASRGDDGAAAAAHHALLLQQLRPLLEAGRTTVLALPAALLARPSVAEAVPPQAWLCVAGLHKLPLPLAQALRQRGVRLGVPDGPPASAPPADFAWLQGEDTDALVLAAERWRDARPQLALLATGLGAVEDVERLLRAGVDLAGGQLQRRRSTLDRPLNAAAHRICELMNHLVLDRETAVVADAVRADVALTYRLLTYANSPALGLAHRSGRSIDSVEQALALLGRQELTRWLQVLLLSSAASRQAGAALQEQALARGRLLEQLARADQLADAPALFSVGLFSMLESLLELPLPKALAPLRLRDEAKAALLQGQGPWAPYLQLAAALDGGDVRTADALAARWGGVARVQPWVDQAWAWAAQVVEQANPARPSATAAAGAAPASGRSGSPKPVGRAAARSQPTRA